MDRTDIPEEILENPFFCQLRAELSTERAKSSSLAAEVQRLRQDAVQMVSICFVMCLIGRFTLLKSLQIETEEEYITNKVIH